MKRSPFVFILILFVTIFAVVLNLPGQMPLSISTPSVPLYGKPIELNTTLPAGDLSTALRRFNIESDFSLRKGLDLEGGTTITLLADMNEVPEADRGSALDSAKEVIERRINLFGVSEPIVQTAKGSGDYRIIAEIPGVTDVNQAVSLIGTTAKLTFWEEGASGSAVLAESLPLNSQVFLGDNPLQTNLSGSDLKKADVVFDPNSGSPTVQLSFTTEGAKKFAEITKRNTGKRLGFALDNVMIDAPYVQTPILDGNAVISGEFTLDQAKNLQLQLNAGALPVSLDVMEQRSIGATLGQDSLQRSLVAGVLGFFVIVVFMIAIYGRLGLLASIALFLYVLINLAIFRLIPVTLTLAGIAGFILSIGIAVDANILIFERMKEELRLGKSRETAITMGFDRAWTSIRDSNMASLITSAILYYFGTGMVRGFALVLAIGVLVSMFSAIIVTKTLIIYFYKR